MNAPSVSVIVPVYNEGGKIGECIEALLAQDLTEAEWEVIVVDNGSTDSTADVVADYPVEFVREDDAVGSYAARNRGIAAAQGAILAFTDADCVPVPGWLRIALAAFEDPAVHVVGGEIAAAPAENEVERYLGAGRFLSHRYGLEHPFLPYFQTANVFYRREVFQRLGQFSADLISGGDVDMCWRAQAAGLGPIQFVPEASVAHHHRSDRDAMLRQSFKWGIGAGRLARLYGNEMGSVRRRIEHHASLHIAGATVRWLGTLPGGLLGGTEGRRQLRWAGWELLGAIRWKKGYRAGYVHPESVRSLRL